MLKRLTKRGEYTHIFIIILMMILYFFTPDVHFNTLDYPDAAPIGQWLQGKIGIIAEYDRFVNIILMLLIAIFTNRITVIADISPRQSFITASLIVLFMLFAPPTAWFTSTLIVMLLLVFALHNLMSMFGKQYPYLMVINASMAIAVSSMILPQTILFIIFMWFAFFTYSVNSWREWIISVIGILLPYVYMLFAYFWNDNLAFIIRLYNNFFQGIGFWYQLPSVYQIISLSALVILFAITAFHFTNDASDKVISIRKKMWITFQFSFLSLLMILLGGEYIYLLLPVMYIPLSIMLGYSLHNSKRSRLYDILTLILFISIIINRLGF
ncbi:MAG: hypothetical protein ACM3ME_07295 [Chloroflexota bacterium]